MPLYDPFTNFGGADVFSSAPAAPAPATVGLTGEVNRQMDQGFFGSLLEGSKELLGFGSEGLQFLEQFGVQPERVLGGGFLPGGPDYVAAPPVAPSSIFSARIGGIPVILLAGGAALWLASR